MATADPDIPVTFRLWAQVRVDAGRSCVEVEVPPGATIGDALALLYRDHPEIARHRESVRAALNNEYVGPDRTVTSGDEISLIPPVQGG